MVVGDLLLKLGFKIPADSGEKFKRFNTYIDKLKERFSTIADNARTAADHFTDLFSVGRGVITGLLGGVTTLAATTKIKTMRAFNTLFVGMEQRAEASLKRTADKLNTTTRFLRRTFTETYSQIDPDLVGRDFALRTTESLTKRAQDIAHALNKDRDEVLNALIDFTKGNFGALQGIGAYLGGRSTIQLEAEAEREARSPQLAGIGRAGAQQFFTDKVLGLTQRYAGRYDPESTDLDVRIDRIQKNFLQFAQAYADTFEPAITKAMSLFERFKKQLDTVIPIEMQARIAAIATVIGVLIPALKSVNALLGLSGLTGTVRLLAKALTAVAGATGATAIAGLTKFGGVLASIAAIAGIGYGGFKLGEAVEKKFDIGEKVAGALFKLFGTDERIKKRADELVNTLGTGALVPAQGSMITKPSESDISSKDDRKRDQITQPRISPQDHKGPELAPSEVINQDNRVITNKGATTTRQNIVINISATGREVSDPSWWQKTMGRIPILNSLSPENNREN